MKEVGRPSRKELTGASLSILSTLLGSDELC